MKRDKSLTHSVSRLFAAFLTGALLTGSLSAAVSANSAQRHWFGTDATGAIVSGEQCPIEVEHETLIFRIGEFPESDYDDAHSFLGLDSHVEAEYKFRNPTDYTVNATLVFPFGRLPDYSASYRLYEDYDLMKAHSGKYTVTVDGMKAEGLTLRHTLFFPGSRFELETDMAKLHDGFMEHDFYSPDLTVTRYTYLSTGIADTQIAAFLPNVDPSETRVLLEKPSGYEYMDERHSRLRAYVSEGQEVIVYAIGEPFDKSRDQFPDWKIYDSVDYTNELDGEMVLTETETLTLKEYALSKYDESSGILDYDWYNAIVEQLILMDKRRLDRSIELDLRQILMRWYQYELELAPGESVYNKVTAPMYPEIDEYYNPPKYTYTYLLSPAECWAKFDKLCILVETDAYMLNAEDYGFARSDSQYEALYGGLPDGELVFTLSESENPKQTRTGISPLLIIPAAAVAVLIGAVVKTGKNNRKDTRT